MTGVTPNGLTLIGLVLGFGACAFFVWNQNAWLFGILIFALGLFDVLDGALARQTGKTSKFGAYLDAVCDRIYEAAVALAVAVVSGYWLLCFLAMAASFLVSYAKARAAMEVFVSNQEWPDLMERAERSILFVLGLIAWGIYPKPVFGHDLLFWALLFLNVATYLTVVQRIWRARQIISSR